MNEKLKQAYLYDFYGELLNEHQRRIYEEFHFQDLSLGEIADEEGISRQGVADVVKRCDRKLEAYEEKLNLVGKFLRIKADAQQIEDLTGRLQNRQQTEEQQYDKETQLWTKSQASDADLFRQIALLAHGIIEEL